MRHVPLRFASTHRAGRQMASALIPRRHRDPVHREQPRRCRDRVRSHGPAPDRMAEPTHPVPRRFVRTRNAGHRIMAISIPRPRPISVRSDRRPPYRERGRGHGHAMASTAEPMRPVRPINPSMACAAPPMVSAPRHRHRRAYALRAAPPPSPIPAILGTGIAMVSTAARPRFAMRRRRFTDRADPRTAATSIPSRHRASARPAMRPPSSAQVRSTGIATASMVATMSVVPPISP